MIYAIYAGLIALLALSLYHDAKERKIPNRYTVAGALFGLAVHVWQEGWSGAAGSLIGLAAGFGTMLAIHLVGAVGAGDVKLFGAIGSMTGVGFVMNGAVNSVLFAAVIGAAIVLVRGELAKRLRHTGALLFNLLVLRDVKGLVRYKRKAATFPFMYAVAPAIAFTATYCTPGL